MEFFKKTALAALVMGFSGAASVSYTHLDVYKRQVGNLQFRAQQH